jgi:streptogrisin C
VDVPGQHFRPGQRIWTFSCNGTRAQTWTFGGNGQIRPAAATGLCLAASSTTNRAQLLLATCSTSSLQKWRW